jgi:hypothetical protein
MFPRWTISVWNFNQNEENCCSNLWLNFHRGIDFQKLGQWFSIFKLLLSKDVHEKFSHVFDLSKEKDLDVEIIEFLKYSLSFHNKMGRRTFLC